MDLALHGKAVHRLPENQRNSGPIRVTNAEAHPVMTLCRSILLLTLSALTTGCITTAEQVAKRNEERCVARGYQPKTDGFNDCVVRLETERDQRMESRRREALEKPDNPTAATRGY
jgi:hypothetical protein